MALNQPLVFRLYFTSEGEVSNAQDQLGAMKVRSDYVKVTNKDEPSKWKLIFLEQDANVGSGFVARLNTKPRQADYFDPSGDWAGPFKTVGSTTQQ